MEQKQVKLTRAGEIIYNGSIVGNFTKDYPRKKYGRGYVAVVYYFRLPSVCEKEFSANTFAELRELVSTIFENIKKYGDNIY